MVDDLSKTKNKTKQNKTKQKKPRMNFIIVGELILLTKKYFQKVKSRVPRLITLYSIISMRKFSIVKKKNFGEIVQRTFEVLQHLLGKEDCY